ncbi:WG repeat-containing protein [Haloferula sp. A504]|uniref:WG repeat-containing protein n=1 Tax=Haloferula sp. A504 TaxID=3373601 RepID=UPI0031C2D33C|nr:WG repeat-containing protein [Verrucomicrobiaceae bacterium E54]
MKKIPTFRRSKWLQFAALSCLAAMVFPTVEARQPPIGQGLFSYSDEGKAGFIDLRGNIVIEAQWDRVEKFSDDRAAVMRDGKWGVIDLSGTVIIPPTWDSIGSFSEDIAIVKKDKLWGAIDKEGQLVIPVEWKALKPSNEGMIAFGDYVHYKGFFATDGEVKLRVPEGFGVPTSFYFGFNEGLTRIQDLKTRKQGYMNTTGEIVIPCEWDFAGRFCEGAALVGKKGAKAGFIDRTGKPIVFEKPDGWEFSSTLGSAYFQHGLAPAKKDGKYGFVDKDGNVAIPFAWGAACPFSPSGYAYVATKTDGDWGWVDTKGNLVHDLTLGSRGIFGVDFYPVPNFSDLLDPVTGKTVLQYEKGAWKCSPDNPFFRLTNTTGSVISCRVVSVEGDKVRLIKEEDRKEYTVPLKSLKPEHVEELKAFAAAIR